MKTSRKAFLQIPFLLLMSILVAFQFCLPAFAQEKSNVVRVGYFAFEGYHNQDEDGSRSGYGYEYLQQMARYTGWTYEYIGYDKSWSDAQMMLEDGEIDLLTSAQKTEEREKIFDFSDDPIGYSSTIFTIKAGNDKFTIDNFSTFEGIRVGMIEGNSRNDEFKVFAAEKGFSYEGVMFDDTELMVAALQDGSIDAVVTSSLRATKGEWIVSEFGFSPYYVCVKKGNQALLDQVNEAIGKINQDNPSLQNELENKYYSVSSGDDIAFTEEERNYIADRVNSGEKLKVMINPDRIPLSYYDGGRFSGLFGDIANNILERSGLPFEVVTVPDRATYREYREQHFVDLCMDMSFDYSVAEEEGYKITDSYNSASISRVTDKNFSGDITSVAAIDHSDIAASLRKNLYGDTEIVYYPTVNACLQAVRDGKQDATYLYTYVAEEILKDDFTHQLSTTLVPDYSTNFCIGIGDTDDPVLFSIINKCVGSIDSSWIDRRTAVYTENEAAGTNLLELIYNDPIAAMIFIAVLLLIIAGFVLLLYRNSARKKDEERAKEIQRLFSYVCGANELVVEVNLANMTAKEYYFKDNALCTDIVPYRTEENFGEFMHPDDYGNVVDDLDMDKLKKLISAGETMAFEARGKGNDGELHWYIYTINGMIPDSIHPCNFMLFKRNINELKIQEEESRKALTDALRVAKEASEAKGNFMSRMSHEIRTPLNAVIGYLTLMEDCLKEPEMVRDYVGKCESAARHLLSIINDVLDISAIESGKIKISSEEFDLKELLSTISVMFYNQAKAKGVDFGVEINDMTDERVIGDSLRLNQILMNLLSNSMKFTPACGKIRLSVTELQAEEEQLRYKLVVADTGIGMTKEFMNRIFSPFEQEKAETARKYGGSGLGLSITNNLVTMMQGSISVESEEGKGTSFTVHLVFKRTGNNKSDGRTSDFSKIRALIVDDESRSCEYMKQLLKRCRVKSDIVTSGEDAVRQIMKRQGTDYDYDFCLIDWNMPGLNGVDTAKKIRSECKSQVPIIIASAYDINEIRDAALSAGVNKLISKPLFQSTMFDLLVDTFGKYDPESGSENKEERVDFSGVRVLLAEDNDMNREIAVSILKKSGLVIDTAVDGKECFDKFTASEPGKYQLILMDVQMPVMDGYEATRAIRNSAHPLANEIPILAMTANAFTEDVTAALSSGMNDHIAKPINYDKLYKLLRKYISQEPKQ